MILAIIVRSITICLNRPGEIGLNTVLEKLFQSFYTGWQIQVSFSKSTTTIRFVSHTKSPNTSSVRTVEYGNI